MLNLTWASLPPSHCPVRAGHQIENSGFLKCLGCILIPNAPQNQEHLSKKWFDQNWQYWNIFTHSMEDTKESRSYFQIVHISVPRPKINKVKVLCFLQLLKFKEEKHHYFFAFWPRDWDMTTLSYRRKLIEKKKLQNNDLAISQPRDQISNR